MSALNKGQEAVRAICSLHSKDGNNCAECRKPYPCMTIKTVMDTMAGGVVGWFL